MWPLGVKHFNDNSNTKYQQMKKIFFISILLIFSINAKAQLSLIDKFSTNYGTEVHEIYADEGSYKELYVTMKVPNNEQDVIVVITKMQLKSLFSALKRTKKKYIKWDEKAQNAHAVSLVKDMKINNPRMDVTFSADMKWYYLCRHFIKTNFVVNSYGKTFCVIETGELVSQEVVGNSYSIGTSVINPFSKNSTNVLSSGSTTVAEQRYCKGGSITFASVLELENFCLKLQDAMESIKKKREVLKSF